MVRMEKEKSLAVRPNATAASTTSKIVRGDMDGIENTVQGMEDVSKYPALFVELARRGYSQADLEKIASRNLLRVMKGAEAYAKAHAGDAPIENPTTF